MKLINPMTWAIIVAVSYWGLDSVIHTIVLSEGQFELLPSEPNEFWMRSLIVILIIAFGVYANRHAKKILAIEQEKQAIYKATVASTQHILNTLMHQMQYFKMLADEHNIFDDETEKLFDDTLARGKYLVDKLSTVETLTTENIRKAVLSKTE